MIALLLALANAEITVESSLVSGQPNVVIVTDLQGHPRGGETVRVVHRPGLRGEREVAIGITDGLGRVRWTPDSSGVAQLKAGDESIPLRIAWPSIPLDTAVLLALLFLASLGSAAYGLLGRSGRVRGT